MEGVRERVFDDCECPWKNLQDLRKVCTCTGTGSWAYGLSWLMNNS